MDATDEAGFSRRGVSATADVETAREDGSVQVLKPYGVGIDTHSEFIAVCVMRQDGDRVVKTEQQFSTEWPSLLQARGWITNTLGLPSDAPFWYCIESTGTYHMPVLLAFGGEPSVVNPLLAGPTRRKTDVLDARLLAHHSITGLWPCSFIPSAGRLEWTNSKGPDSF
jgi:hypothetical protein